MTAAFVSESGIDVYKDISNYITDNLNQEVNFVSGFSYKTVNEMIDQNVVDLAFVCGLPYILKRDINHPTIQLLAAPVMQAQRYKDKPIYYSDIIVHKDSPYKNFNDLANTIFVYNDEISNSGYNMPRAHLISKKKTNGYFKKILRSGSHEESIRMIAKGEADVSAIDSLVLDYDLIHYPEYASQVRIIESLGPASIPPVIASNKMPQKLFSQIQEILINMHKTSAGKKILNKAHVKRFDIVSDNHYDDIRAMNNAAIESDYEIIR